MKNSAQSKEFGYQHSLAKFRGARSIILALWLNPARIKNTVWYYKIDNFL
jgi:hypothetical protein